MPGHIKGNAHQKSNLRVVTKPTPGLRLGGTAPSEDMQPGNFLVECETAWLEAVGKTMRAVLQFRVVDGKHDGVALRLWVTASDGGGIVSPTGRYAKLCEIAFGRRLQDDDPVGDPAQIFGGRFFTVQVGYRKTDKPKGGQTSDENAKRCKDDRDFLRAHDIISRVEF